MASFIAPAFFNDACPSSPLRTSRTNSSLTQPSSMFSSLRHTLSRKGKNTELAKAMDGKKHSAAHPQSIVPPATRRPAVPPTVQNPFRTMNTGDSPPPYSPAPVATAPLEESVATAASRSQEVADDPYAFLSSFDIIFLIDDSGSMAGSRWREAERALASITPICTAHDADGIDIDFLNHPTSPAHHNLTHAGDVERIFRSVRPGGGTPTGQRLNQLLKPYLRRYEAAPDATKPLNIIVLTDGEPSDDVESPLIAAAKKLDKLDAPAWQVGVQFFQVGRDEAAKRHLSQLDDELAELAGDDDLRDIVDTVPYRGVEGTELTGQGILKVVLGAVNRRLDRKKSGGLHQ